MGGIPICRNEQSLGSHNSAVGRNLPTSPFPIDFCNGTMPIEICAKGLGCSCETKAVLKRLYGSGARVIQRAMNMLRSDALSSFMI